MIRKLCYAAVIGGGLALFLASATTVGLALAIRDRVRAALRG